MEDDGAREGSKPSPLEEAVSDLLQAKPENRQEAAEAVLELCALSGKERRTKCSLKAMASKESALLTGVLREVETGREDKTLLACLATLRAFLDSANAWRRQRLLAAVNGVLALCRQLLHRIRSAAPKELVDELAAILVLVAARDPRAALKLRLSGLLALLLGLPRPLSPPLSDLLLLASKSGRNGTVIGKDREFLRWLVGSLKAGGRADADAALVRRNAEILFYLCRARKNRERLMSVGVTSELVGLLRRLGGGQESGKTSLLVVASLRQIAKTKGGREELSASLPVLEAGMKEALRDDSSSGEWKRAVDDAVATLCLRLLPSQTLPLEGSAVKGLAFALPTEARALLKSAPHDGDARDDSDGDSDPDQDPDHLPADDLDSQDEDPQDPPDPSLPSPNSAASLTKTKGHQRRGSAENFQFLAELSKKKATTKGSSPATNGEAKNSSKKEAWEPMYRDLARKTSSVGRFVKLAYPDAVGAFPDLPRQPLKHFPRALQEGVLEALHKSRHPTHFPSQVVFDLDGVAGPATGATAKALDCPDAAAVLKTSKRDSEEDGVLSFESRFESGNLRRATRTGPWEYQLQLSPDLNQLAAHSQWFYFAVSGARPETPYTLTVANFLKSHSMFSQGMQPVVFSVREAEEGRSGWVRAGHGIAYFRNSSSQPNGRGLFSLRFTITFRHARDVCYLAYHFPYTATRLQAQIRLWRRLAEKDASVYWEAETLATTLGGNEVPLLTITAAKGDANLRRYVFLSARVHPGESNASWMMDGTVSALLSPAAKHLRESLVFKVVPMLNPDGVINGSHRCSLVGQDLNRQWARPSPLLHPEIAAAKALIARLAGLGKTPWVFCDYHGHSRRSNVFVFGNNPEESWRVEDATEAAGRQGEWSELPEALASAAPAFSLADCRFDIAKGKESAARVVVWREFRCPRAYTMEATYCGADRGPYQGYHLGTRELRQMGAHFVQALGALLPDVPGEKDAKKEKTLKHRQASPKTKARASPIPK